MKPDDADSESKRLAVNNWYDSTLCSRLNNKNEGVIILVMQHLHLDDLVAHVTEAEEWTKIDIPAIAFRDQDYRLNDHEVHSRRPVICCIESANRKMFSMPCARE